MTRLQNVRMMEGWQLVCYTEATVNILEKSRKSVGSLFMLNILFNHDYLISFQRKKTLKQQYINCLRSTSVIFANSENIFHFFAQSLDCKLSVETHIHIVKHIHTCVCLHTLVWYESLYWMRAAGILYITCSFLASIPFCADTHTHIPWALKAVIQCCEFCSIP